MASKFYMPDWAFAPPSPPAPPPPPTAADLSIPVEAYATSTSYAMDPTLALGPDDWDEVDRANAARVDQLNNEFIDRQGEILHDGDDAFFKQTGRDAILNAPAIHARLEAARQETLGRAANDVQREWLGETLGKHKIVEHFDIGDHVGRQSLAWQKSINRRRLDLLNRQAGIDHADLRMIQALANSSESSARDHARASGHRPDSPEAQAEVDIARSAVFRHAIEGALAKGAHSAAIKLHERAKDKLAPGDAELLDKIIEDAREMEIGKEYVAKIAPTSAMTNRSVADLDKMQAEATSRNNEDWKDNEAQRATNQHFINVQFAKAKRQAEMDKAKLIQTVHDWLVTPRADGRPQTQRPPIATWVRLDEEEQHRVDIVLGQNALGPIAAVGDNNLILAQSGPDDKFSKEAWRRFGRQPAPKDNERPAPKEIAPAFPPIAIRFPGRSPGAAAPKATPAPSTEAPRWPVKEPKEQYRSAIDELRQIDPSNPELSKTIGPRATPSEEDVARVRVALLRARQKATGAAGTSESKIGIGPHAKESIPARSIKRDFNKEERAEIDRIGYRDGCHTCGIRDPGTRSGSFVLDHQRPSSLNPPGEAQRLYPQCLTCSRRQGGLIAREIGREKP